MNGPELSGYVSKLKIAAKRDRAPDLAASAPGDAAEFVREQMLAGMTINEICIGDHDEIDLPSLKLVIDPITEGKKLKRNPRGAAR